MVMVMVMVMVIIITMPTSVMMNPPRAAAQFDVATGRSSKA